MIPRYIPSYGLREAASAFSIGDDGDALQKLFGARKSFFFDSGSEGLCMALKGLGLKGRVLLSSYTCIKVPEAILSAGCEPVFADLESDGASFDPAVLADFDEGELCAIIVTHLWGFSVDVGKILQEARRIGAIVIEDCALSLGSSMGDRMVGMSGSLAVFSFGRGKTLNLGGGGALVVNDPSLADTLMDYFGPERNREVATLKEKVKTVLLAREMWAAYFPWLSYLKYLRQGSWLWERGITSPQAMNCSSGPGASVFLDLLASVDAGSILEHKRKISELYRFGIAERPGVRSFIRSEDAVCICPAYPLIVQGRGEFFRYLRQRGVDCGLSFSYSAGKVCSGEMYPEAERIAESIVTLPVHENVTEEKALKIIGLVNGWGPRATRAGMDEKW
ncbi:MAG: hypothetical protein HKL98_12045 [Burkholderiales bacterium]|nr:hypothetical protein [Burkholderiales bacterium]